MVRVTAPVRPAWQLHARS